MWTIAQLCSLTGLSRRTLQYYDRIGLLKPAQYTAAGYRMYDEASLERLQQILIYRELQLPLSTIHQLLESTTFDRGRALDEQIEMLTKKKQHLENLILFARGLRVTGVQERKEDTIMDFSVFREGQLDEYARQAREVWGKTNEYREFEQKQQGRTPQDQQQVAEGLMNLFEGLGRLKELPAQDETVQQQIQAIRDYISAHYYQCSVQVFAGLGKMYAGGGSMTENIDARGGQGTAAFAQQAIRIYCERNQ